MKVSNNVTASPEARITLSVQQLEGIVRKAVREELMEFAAQRQAMLQIDRESPLHKDMEDIFERKESDQLRFHTHEDIWKE